MKEKVKKVTFSEVFPYPSTIARLSGGWRRQPADCLHKYTARFELLGYGKGVYCKDCGAVTDTEQ